MSQSSLRGGSLTVKPLGGKLLELRNAKGLKQSEVEIATSLPELRLSLYERNKNIPLSHLKALAEFYGVKAKDLVDPESLARNANLTLDLISLHEFSVIPNSSTEPK